MALVLGLRMLERVEVGEKMFTVTDILDKGSFFMAETGGSEAALVVSYRAHEIMSNVFVSAGHGSKRIARLVIEAPKNIKIMRRGLA